MATEIGQLSVKLLMDSDKLREGAVKAKNSLRDVELGSIAMKAGLAAAATAAVGAATAIFAIASETAQAAKEQAQLAAVLKSTGQAAGYTQNTLNGMGDAMRKATSLDGGDITQAQTALLAFTNIVGEQFPQALQAAADMSARTGMSIQQTSELIGRALDVPSQGMAALSKQGFRFSDDQKEVIKRLEETGRVAEAQAIILDALKDTYGGAAEAARKTFGGALEAVKNSLKELVTGQDGSFDGAAESVNNLAKTLDSPEVKAGINTLVSGLASIASAAVSLIADVASAAAHTASFTQWLFGGIDNNNIGQVQEKLGEVTAGIDELNKKRKDGYSLTAQEYARLASLMQQQKELNKTVADYEGNLRKEEQAQKAAMAAAEAGRDSAKREADAKLAAEAASKRLAEAQKLQAGIAEADKARRAEIANIIGAEADAIETLGMSYAELTRRKLELLGADEQQMQRGFDIAGVSQDIQKEWAAFDNSKLLGAGNIFSGGSEFSTDEEKENERFAAQKERFAKHLEEMQILGQTSQVTMEDLERVHQENLSNIRRQFTDADISKTQSALGSISTLMNSHSRKMFEIGKAASIANTIISTAEGVMAAWKIPFVGWAMAPLVAAAGIAQIQAIRSTTFGGGGSPAVSNTQAVNAASTPVAEQRPTQRTNINLQGDFFSRDGVISLLNEAFKDGYTLSGGATA